MIQLSYEHDGKKAFFAINIEHIVYFEAAENTIDGTKSYVHLSTKSTLRVAETYDEVYDLINSALKGDNQ